MVDGDAARLDILRQDAASVGGDVLISRDVGTDLSADRDVVSRDGPSDVRTLDTVRVCVSDNDCEIAGLEALACSQARCVAGQCQLMETDCNDGDYCTLDECNEEIGACVHTPSCECPAVPCDEDDDPCTVATCVGIDGGIGRCDFVVADRVCDDRDPCTIGERCVESQDPGAVAICGGGAPRDCDDGDPETYDFCDRTHEPPCRNVAVSPCPFGQDDCPPAAPCVAFVCDQADPEDPRCRPVIYAGAVCDDVDFCTVGETCSEDGRCGGGAPRGCDDGDWFTVDLCDSVEGICIHNVRGDVSCVAAEDCEAALGQRLGPCRTWVCADSYCLPVDTGNIPCDDGDWCTVDDRCDDGSCAPGPPRDCGADCPSPSTPRCVSEESRCACEPAG